MQTLNSSIKFTDVKVVMDVEGWRMDRRVVMGDKWEGGWVEEAETKEEERWLGVVAALEPNNMEKWIFHFWLIIDTADSSRCLFPVWC